MIRLGSLAGYPFEGPRVLAGWTPPPLPAVYAVMYRPDADRERYAVLYVGHSEDLTLEGFPFRHPRSACWVKRAGSRYNLFVCFYVVPGGLVTHREQIVQELCAVYGPGCNEQQFDQSWKDEWIGEYSAPSTGAMTMPRTPAATREDTDPQTGMSSGT